MPNNLDINTLETWLWGRSPILNKSNFEGIMVISPTLIEQQQIALTLSVIDTKIESEENKKQALDALFKTLLSLLMTGKIRVKDLEV